MDVSNNTWRVLSLDGGGIRGIVTLDFLDRLSAELGGYDWLNKIDLFAGTSTGGLIALGLASGRTIPQLKKLYVDRGEVIFASIWKRLFGHDGVLIKNIFTSRYDNKVLEAEVRKELPALTLGQLPRKVLITSFDLGGDRLPQRKRWKAKFFHNFAGQDNGPTLPQSDWNLETWKAAVSTASAPTYMPDFDRYIDGGVVAVNPSMAALAQLLDARYFRPARGFRSHPDDIAALAQFAPQLVAPRIPDEVRLLSIGTGEVAHRIPAKDSQRITWGFLSYISPFNTPKTPLLKLMLDGDTGVAHYQVKQLLGDNYRRLDVEFDPEDDFDMDDPTAIPKMLAYMGGPHPTREIRQTAAWISGTW
jgi:hypothetical protein